MRLREDSLMAIVLLTVSVPALASDYYPIDTGRFWTYSAQGGLGSSATIDDPDTFAGSAVQPLHWDTDVREFFSEDGAGRVFQHGLKYPDGSYAIFDPPFLKMDSDLTPGHQWETTFDVVFYNAGGVETSRQSTRIACYVIGVETVTVPAGTFEAIDVLITRNIASLPFYQFHEWYAEDVGFIQRSDNTGVIYQLTGYGPTPTATEATSWGAVKALFRD